MAASSLRNQRMDHHARDGALPWCLGTRRRRDYGMRARCWGTVPHHRKRPSADGSASSKWCVSARYGANGRTVTSCHIRVCHADGLFSQCAAVVAGKYTDCCLQAFSGFLWPCEGIVSSRVTSEEEVNRRCAKLLLQCRQSIGCVCVCNRDARYRRHSSSHVTDSQPGQL